MTQLFAAAPTRPVISVGPTPAPWESPPSAETACEILERFGQTLQACDATDQQVRVVLESVRDCLDADFVFWEPGTTGDAFVSVGEPPLSAEWCRSFIQCVLEETPAPQGQLLRSVLELTAQATTPAPSSAAFVRLSKSRDVWLVALSFRARRQFRPVDLKVMMLARRMLLNHRQQVHAHERLRESLFGLVRCLTAAIDAKDPYTWGHSERVARIAVRLGREMGLPPTFLSDLYLAGLLHDVGKIGTRDSVLQKPGPLTPEEFAHIQEHPVTGDNLVANVKALQHLRPGVRNHHERWDGTRYPDRLAGEDIPLMARVLAVADSCDAMMAARPYRPAVPTARIDEIMRSGAGSQWDPSVIGPFLACRQELYPICQRGLGDSVVVAVDRAINVARGE